MTLNLNFNAMTQLSSNYFLCANILTPAFSMCFMYCVIKMMFLYTCIYVNYVFSRGPQGRIAYTLIVLPSQNNV